MPTHTPENVQTNPLTKSPRGYFKDKFYGQTFRKKKYNQDPQQTNKTGTNSTKTHQNKHTLTPFTYKHTHVQEGILKGVT